MLLITLGLVALTILVHALLQGDIMSAPVVVAIMAVLAIPAITSILTAGLRYLAKWIKPEAVLYIASLIVVALVQWMAGIHLPGLADSPTATVALWLSWATANSLLAATLYEVFLKRLLPTPDPTPDPAPPAPPLSRTFGG